MFSILKSLSSNERRSVGLLFLYGFGSAAAYVLARTIADSAFLSHIGPKQLPKVYMLSAGVVALSSLIYARIVQNVGLRRVVLLTLLGLAAGSAVLPMIMEQYSSSLTVFAAAYLLAQVRGSLGTIQYATLLNEHFAQRGPERVVGLIGAGATLAGILVGSGIGYISPFVNIELLMYVAAFLDLATMLPVFMLRTPRTVKVATNAGGSLQVPLPYASNSGGLREAVASRYVLGIAGMIVMCVLAATFVEFQWKVTAASELNRNKQEMARYFGYFYGCVYLVTGLLQLFVTGRVFQRRGVLVGLLAFPTALFAATISAGFAASQRMLFLTLTMSKGCDALKRSMNDPATQVLYSPLLSGLRRQAITLVAGIAKPLAEAVAAVTLVVATPWVSNRHLSLLILSLVVVWLLISWGVFRRFTELRLTGRDREKG